MPEIIVWPVSSSVRTLKDGSSVASFCRDKTELFLVGLAFRFDRDRYDRIGKIDRFKNDRLVFVAQRIAGRRGFQPDRGGDVAGINFLDLFALVRVHLEQAADSLSFSFGRIINAGAGSDRAGIDAKKRQRTDERIGHDLKREGGKWRVIFRRPLRRQYWCPAQRL